MSSQWRVTTRHTYSLGFNLKGILMVARTKIQARSNKIAAEASVSPRVVRTGEGLRDALFDTLEGLRAGTIKPNDAVAAAKVVCQIISTVRLEMDYQNHLKIHKNPPVEPLRLGSPG